MNKHPIVWTQPAPFWPEATSAVAAPPEFARPAILRFATDTFMDDYLQILAADPRQLGEYRARPETWRGFLPPPAAPAILKTFALAAQRRGIALRNKSEVIPSLPKQPAGEPATPERPLKLYQPAHGRFYLVTACLVCETAGLPDRRIDAAQEEKGSFVLRRLLPPDPLLPKDDLPVLDEATWDEYAFISGPRGSFWQKLKPLPQTPPNAAPEAMRRRILPGEERLPLFGTRFEADDHRERRLLAGTIPVARREAYVAAPAGTGIDPAKPPGTSDITARKTLLRTLFSEPWKALVDRVAQFAEGLAQASPIPPAMGQPDLAGLATAFSDLREQIQTSSWLILVDFADFLRTYLPALYDAVADENSTPGGPIGAALDALRQTTLSSIVLNGTPLAGGLAPAFGTPTRLADSLDHAVRLLIQNPAWVRSMESTHTTYQRKKINDEWPDFLFPLADPVDLTSSKPPDNPLTATSLEDDGVEIAAATSPATAGAAASFKRAIDHLAALIVSALPAQDATPAPAPSAAAQKPCDLRQAWFVLRCVYERPACGPLHEDIVSARSEPFQLASFFDPDAPARPIRIGLPLDTSPAGLRKFDKNTAFMMSDVLCGQFKRLKGLSFGDLIRSQLPWPLHKDLSVPEGGPCTTGDGSATLGTICSLSIPIITICALILLIIMVSLLDIIFRWLPYFIICFPLPGLRGKKP